MGFQIANKVALVTGANRGIGKAIVNKLFAEGAQKVYLAVRKLDSVAEQQAAFGSKVTPLLLDLNKPETIQKAAEEAKDVALLINNAGYLQAADLFSDEFEAALGNELEVNAFGLLRVARAFDKVLSAQPEAALVQLNSVASMRNFDGITSYSASKAVSYSVTQALRNHWGQAGVQVLSVHPGPIATDMTKQLGMDEGATAPERVADAIVKALAEGRFHCFPDPFAQSFEAAYQGFARDMVEADINPA